MKKILVFLTLIGISLSFFAGAVNAKNNQHEIPEVDGIYSDPGHSGLKIRVIVHRAKPGPPPEPTLQCDGITDPGSTAVVTPAGWKLPPTWTYNLNPTSVPSSVGGQYLADFAASGFSEWRSATGNKVSFVQGSDTTITRQAYDNQNIVAWGRVSSQNALAVTYIRYYQGGEAVDVDTIMNKKYAWSWADQSQHDLCAYEDTYDAQNILTHELGHWVGLNDHYTSEYTENTMYGYGSKMEIKKDTLTQGDITGASNIYNNN